MLHECVRSFDSAPLKKIFAEKEGCLKQPCTKIVDGASAAVYHNREQVFSPFDCGVPADRRRRYNYWKSGGGGDVQDHSFEDLFFRKTVASPAVYLEHHRQNEAVDGKSGLTPFRYRMWESYVVMAAQRGIYDVSAAEDARWKVECAIVDLRQNASHVQRFAYKAVPALLKGSMVFDLVSDREYSIAELWMVQGVPHPVAVRSDAKLLERCCFLPAIDSSSPSVLPEASQRQMVGNAMHSVQIYT